MKTQRGKAWSADEDAIMERVYRSGGVAAVKARTGRGKSSIVARAARLGLTCDRELALAEPLTPVPRMDLLESLACVQMRKWMGPVNRSRALSPAIGRAA